MTELVTTSTRAALAPTSHARRRFPQAGTWQARTRLVRAWTRGLGVATLALLVAPLALLVAACANTRATALHVTIADADRDADVFIDGQYVGQVQEIQGTAAGEVLLGPGVHRLEIRKPGRFPVQKTVEVTRRPERTTTVEAELLVDPP